MKIQSKLSRLRRDDEGATLMEFGLIAGPLIALLFGIMEIGYQGYVDTMSKSIMHQVARQASVGGKSVAQIETEIKDGLDPLLLSNATVDVKVRSYFEFTNIGKPEKLTKDINNDGNLDSGDCYLDGNDNGVFDINTGRSGTGGPDDIVNYEITIVSPRVFPLTTLFGGSKEMTSYNATAVRNQPYGSQVPDPELCEP
ncbi:TadE/TadG family type IV pilus assembly protein [Parasphingorhabdus sp.]|jgi:Flp pilus assembly protein TadG|uniref:TadE/TadG family type IV pilus assembly protein n=1 Tax=Parasphingorhabdus sp. TaxID=2709688 RepID=UPI003BAEDD4B